MDWKLKVRKYILFYTAFLQIKIAQSSLTLYWECNNYFLCLMAKSYFAKCEVKYFEVPLFCPILVSKWNWVQLAKDFLKFIFKIHDIHNIHKSGKNLAILKVNIELTICLHESCCILRFFFQQILFVYFFNMILWQIHWMVEILKN